MNLSDEAKSALIDTPASLQATLVAPCSALTASELRRNRLIGRLGGLTRAGCIERERLLAEAEDKAFG